MPRRLLVVGLVLFVMASCGQPSQEDIQAAVQQTQAVWTPVPSQTLQPTYTPLPTLTAEPTIFVTKIVVVTATGSPTPRYTPTVTPTPSETPMPTETPDVTQTAEAEAQARLTEDKFDGFYLVGIDMAPGRWRSKGTGDDCYWSRTDELQEIIDNHFGLAGGAVTLRASDYQFESQGCGGWTYLGP